jgi:demethylmenaquinone methyltransferase/2-methoxy-6-polyprenyl-1,4-benzoquinol methylase
MSKPLFDDEFLARQQEYYRARAGEYDEWWDRRGRYDHGPLENAAWFRERTEVAAAWAATAFTGEVLELACGTGFWTSRLAQRASVTAIDGSPEMLRAAAVRPGNERVRFRQADLFAWEPERQYDAIFFGFWLSHVPPERLEEFLRKVKRAIRPGGKVFMVDSLPDPITTSPDQPLPTAEQPWLERRLNDGRTFSIIKVFYTPERLNSLFSDADLRFYATQTRRFFLYGSGTG